MMKIIVIGLVLMVCLLWVGYIMSRMPGRSYATPLPELTATERLLAENLHNHIDTLAASIGERNIWQHDNLQNAAEYIEAKFLAAGLEVRSQFYEVSGKRVRNIEAVIQGTGGEPEVVVVGAHYDSLAGTVGANDNASGMAALLELARLCSQNRYGRTIRFVAFVNEEPPFFKSVEMGSRVYVEDVVRRGEHVSAMISLETVGYYTDEPLTQKFPLPLLHMFYPRSGSFVAFVGNFKYRDLLRTALGAFRKHANFPSEGIVAPGWLVGVDWSDHWSFWEAGYPAIMVTDTAFFRYPYYHSSKDTPDKINYPALARVTSGLLDVVAELGR